MINLIYMKWLAQGFCLHGSFYSLFKGFMFFHFQYFLRHTCSDIFWVDMDSAKRFYLLSHVCFFVLLSESQRALRSQRRKPRIGGMHYDKGHTIFFFVSFVLFLVLSTFFFLGGGVVSKIRLSIIDSSFKCKLQMPRGNERGRTFDFCVQFKRPIIMTQKNCS